MTRVKKMSLERAVELIERDHGGCDQNTCTISVALRHGFACIAIDSWTGSGAASKEFDDVTLPFDLKDIQEESALMCAEVPHVDCPNCNAVLWDPEDCAYWCDSCGKKIEVAS